MAVLEFELRKAYETIKSLRGSLTEAATGEGEGGRGERERERERGKIERGGERGRREREREG